MGLRIEPARNPADLDRMRALFREYADRVGIDLAFQGFTRSSIGFRENTRRRGGAVAGARRLRRDAGLRRVERSHDRD
jgi:hypothetical protein